MLQKLKSWLVDDVIFYGVLLVLVALASFGLGRQSVLSGKSPENPLITKKNVTPAAVIQAVGEPLATSTVKVSTTAAPKSVAVVGSKSGTKYHLPDCSGAKRIKPENLISFESIAAAEAAGYTAAANCPGLQ